MGRKKAQKAEHARPEGEREPQDQPGAPGPGLAAEYYGDNGQSVLHQPGYMPSSDSGDVHAHFPAKVAQVTQPDGAEIPEVMPVPRPSRPSPAGFTQASSSQWPLVQKLEKIAPFQALADFFRDPEGVAQFEEYSEAVGICRHCFQPGSSLQDAPRSHVVPSSRAHQSPQRRRIPEAYQSPDVTRRKGSEIRSVEEARSTVQKILALAAPLRSTQGRRKISSESDQDWESDYSSASDFEFPSMDDYNSADSTNVIRHSQSDPLSTVQFRPHVGNGTPMRKLRWADQASSPTAISCNRSTTEPGDRSRRSKTMYESSDSEETNRAHISDSPVRDTAAIVIEPFSKDLPHSKRRVRMRDDETVCTSAINPSSMKSTCVEKGRKSQHGEKDDDGEPSDAGSASANADSPPCKPSTRTKNGRERRREEKMKSSDSELREADIASTPAISAPSQPTIRKKDGRDSRRRREMESSESELRDAENSTNLPSSISTINASQYSDSESCSESPRDGQRHRRTVPLRHDTAADFKYEDYGDFFRPACCAPADRSQSKEIRQDEFHDCMIIDAFPRHQDFPSKAPRIQLIPPTPPATPEQHPKDQDGCDAEGGKSTDIEKVTECPRQAPIPSPAADRVRDPEAEHKSSWTDARDRIFFAAAIAAGAQVAGLCSDHGKVAPDHHAEDQAPSGPSKVSASPNFYPKCPDSRIASPDANMATSPLPDHGTCTDSYKYLPAASKDISAVELLDAQQNPASELPSRQIGVTPGAQEILPDETIRACSDDGFHEVRPSRIHTERWLCLGQDSRVSPRNRSKILEHVQQRGGQMLDMQIGQGHDVSGDRTTGDDKPEEDWTCTTSKKGKNKKGKKDKQSKKNKVDTNDARSMTNQAFEQGSDNALIPRATDRDKVFEARDAGVEARASTECIDKGPVLETDMRGDEDKDEELTQQNCDFSRNDEDDQWTKDQLDVGRPSTTFLVSSKKAKKKKKNALKFMEMDWTDPSSVDAAPHLRETKPEVEDQKDILEPGKNAYLKLEGDEPSCPVDASITSNFEQQAKLEKSERADNLISRNRGSHVDRDTTQDVNNGHNFDDISALAPIRPSINEGTPREFQNSKLESKNHSQQPEGVDETFDNVSTSPSNTRGDAAGTNTKELPTCYAGDIPQIDLPTEELSQDTALIASPENEKILDSTTRTETSIVDPEDVIDDASKVGMTPKTGKRSKKTKKMKRAPRDFAKCDDIRTVQSHDELQEDPLIAGSTRQEPNVFEQDFGHSSMTVPERLASGIQQEFGVQAMDQEAGAIARIEDCKTDSGTRQPSSPRLNTFDRGGSELDASGSPRGHQMRSSGHMSSHELISNTDDLGRTSPSGLSKPRSAFEEKSQNLRGSGSEDISGFAEELAAADRQRQGLVMDFHSLSNREIKKSEDASKQANMNPEMQEMREADPEITSEMELPHGASSAAWTGDSSDKQTETYAATLEPSFQSLGDCKPEDLISREANSFGTDQRQCSENSPKNRFAGAESLMSLHEATSPRDLDHGSARQEDPSIATLRGHSLTPGEGSEIIENGGDTICPKTPAWTGERDENYCPSPPPSYHSEAEADETLIKGMAAYVSSIDRPRSSADKIQEGSPLATSVRKKQSTILAETEQRLALLTSEYTVSERARSNAEKRCEEQARDFENQRQAYEEAVASHRSFAADKERVLKDVHEDAANAKQEQAQLREKHDEVQSRMSDYVRKIEQLQALHWEAEQRLEDKEQTMKQLRAQHESVKGKESLELEMLRTRHEAIERQLQDKGESHSLELETLRTQHKESQRQFRDKSSVYSMEVETLRSQHEDAMRLLKEKSENHTLELETLRSQHQESQSRQQQLEDHTTELEQLRGDHAEALQRLTELEGQCGEIEAAAERQLQKKDNKFEQLQKEGAEEIRRLQVRHDEHRQRLQQAEEELEEHQTQVERLKQQILAMDVFPQLAEHDEDYFENRCQTLYQHLTSWVVRYSKLSDLQRCLLLDEVDDEGHRSVYETCLLDGSDVDDYLQDRLARRNIFVSVVMSLLFKYVFTRYLFGMDREHRQKLKTLDKTLQEVGPTQAVHRWRAITLSLLSQRPAFKSQRDADCEAVVEDIWATLDSVLPAPETNAAYECQASLRRIVDLAVDLSIDMRLQCAEYSMLPPPERTSPDEEPHFYFTSVSMAHVEPSTLQDDELEHAGARLRLVLFPLVVKSYDDQEQIVVFRAQVQTAPI